MKKTNNKGFTLVELIVVLVILAILAAILVPALLGYIDKAREKQITTNAEAAYVAAQALATEAYGKNTDGTKKLASTDITKSKIAGLTDIDSTTFSIKYTVVSKSATGHNGYIIDTFTYTEGDRTALWTKKANLNVTVTRAGKTTTETSSAGGWIVGDKDGVAVTP